MNEITEDNYNIDLTSSIKELADKYAADLLEAASKRFIEVEKRLSVTENKINSQNVNNTHIPNGSYKEISITNNCNHTNIK